jgi:hypothetical protein
MLPWYLLRLEGERFIRKFPFPLLPKIHSPYWEKQEQLLLIPKPCVSVPCQPVELSKDPITSSLGTSYHKPCLPQALVLHSALKCNSVWHYVVYSVPLSWTMSLCDCQSHQVSLMRSHSWHQVSWIQHASSNSKAEVLHSQWRNRSNL